MRFAVNARRIFCIEPCSEKTKQLIKDFRTEWLDPLNKSIESVATAFLEMPRKEKAEEVVALVGQILATKGFGKLADLALKEAQILGEIDLVAKLGEIGAPAIDEPIRKLISRPTS